MNLSAPQVQYRSEPADVSMGDDYYELADLSHFWIVHRLKIVELLYRRLNLANDHPRVADIGCGHGLLQSQLMHRYGWIVDGYDLNQAALSNSIAIQQPVVFYNINERHSDLNGLYDLIFLFDVIEHLEDEHFFLESVKYHLKSDGILIVNVPAGPWLFSRYDDVAGHYRRYTWKSLNTALNKVGFSALICSYWGLLYLPLAIIRKLMLAAQPWLSNSEVNAIGFKPPSRLLNKLLTYVSRFDPIPNYFAGSSLMGIYKLDDVHD